MSEKKLHILLVDDEAEISSLISSMLQRSGHSVDLAGDGQEALALLEKEPERYGLVITDSNMPVVSGIELIEHLRKTAYPGKIILLSGYATDELKDVYAGLRIDMVIQKPFSFAELTKAVKEITA